MDIPRYIHYGATEFIPTKGFPIKNREYFMKPKGGLWASRKNASFGWKDWCKEEDFRDCDMANSFEFIFAKQAKIVTISTVKQLYNLPRLKNDGLAWGYSIDFEKCLHLGIDAIELCWYGDEYRDAASGNLHYELYGWDCDSVVVLNPDVIIPLYSSKERAKVLSCTLESKLVTTT